MRAPEPVDVGLAAAGLALSLPLAIPSAHATPAVALVVAQALALLFLRREPVRVLVAVLVLGAPLLAISPYLLSFGPAGIALCGVAWLRPPRVSLRALAALLLVAPLNLLEGGPAQVLLAVFGAGLSWSLGELGRLREVRVLEARERARSEERARISRELHDVLAHSLSVIVVQSAAAGDVFATHPDAARDALDAIEGTARTALGDLRRVLDTVHTDATTREPQPGLARIDGLAAPLRAAGLTVDVDVAGGPAQLPPVVDVSAYRIVQEALTNALRHARARRVTVAVHYSETAVAISVTDDGVGEPGAAGRGITGMRERAALLGGTLDAAPANGGGFRVAARLPRGA